MEDFQEQEYEFLRRLEEERVDRRTIVRRGLAAGIGLTVLSLSPTALAARKQALANPPVAGRLVVPGRDGQGGEEGRRAQHDRAPARLGELRRDDGHVRQEVRHQDHERQPGRQLGSGEPGDSLAQGRLACARLRRRRRIVRHRRCERGVVRQVLPEGLQDDPAGDEGHAWVLDGRLLGRDLDRLQPEPRLQPAEDVEGPAQARVQGQGRAQRQSAHVQLRRLRRDRRRDGERRQSPATSSRASTSSRS